PSAQSHDARRIGGIRQDETRHLARARGRGDARARGGRAMSGLSQKAIERLLYLISPIALLIVWQLLLEAGIGDRRFMPAPTDIAVRFVQMLGAGEVMCAAPFSPVACVTSVARWLGNGELEWHTAVTLWRVFAGFFVGAIPAVAIGLLMAMFRPV